MHNNQVVISLLIKYEVNTNFNETDFYLLQSEASKLHYQINVSPTDIINIYEVI